MINTVAIAAMSNGGTGTITAPPVGRSLLFPHASFRIIQRWTDGTDDAFANAHYSHILGGTLTTHPNATSVQRYILLMQNEINNAVDWTGTAWNPGSDDAQHAVAWAHFADAYATANGQNVEDYWLHAKTGTKTNSAGVMSISAAGAIVFNAPNGGGYTSSYVYSLGMTVTLSGFSVGNGTYTVASLTRSGMTISGWTSGALGPSAYGITRIGTVYTPGDGTITLANRVQNWGWAGWTSLSNFNNTNARGMHAARIAGSLVIGGIANVNGVMNDSMASGDVTRLNVLNTAEYGSSSVAQFTNDLCTTLTTIRAYPGGPKYYRANTSGYISAGDVQVSNAAGGIHDETALGITPYSSTDQYYSVRNLVNSGVDVEYSWGGVFTITGGVGTYTGTPATMTIGNYPTKTARYMMTLYCNYLLVVDVTHTAPDGTTYKHAIMDTTNGYNVGQGPLSAMWTPAWEYNIGQPLGAATVSAVLIDPSGQRIITFQRAFTLDDGATMSAYVMYAGNTGGQTNYGDNSLMPITIPAAPSGKVWRMLNADGTFGSVVTTAGVRRAEGLILVAL